MGTWTLMELQFLSKFMEQLQTFTEKLGNLEKLAFLSNVLMIYLIGLHDYASKLEAVFFATVKDGKFLAKDFRGNAEMSDFPAEICHRVQDK